MADSATEFQVGSLVSARGREWLVLPASEQPELLVLRPLGATDDEITGIMPALESVTSAVFEAPDPGFPGDALRARLLRDGLRLGFRASAGPFRSFGQIAVDPRPYQLVPLLMALKLDPVRLLIADDVGIGKTIEAALIARELLDRGDIERFAVLCPPHLAEQWQEELRSKFNLNAELVLTSTAGRLERGLPVGRSLFEEYPFVIVSTEFIKSERRREDFVRACPGLVIVDEAHTFAFGARDRGRHQRYELLKSLGDDPSRNLVLVTATPHSGKTEAFRSLLALLEPSLGDLPEDLSGEERQADRRHLARHLVQRRRADINAYLDEDTPFPDRLSRDVTYELSDPMRELLDDALAWARELVSDESGDQQRQRGRWWSALALLRSIGSSPAAAVATLRTRAESLGATSLEEIEELGHLAVLDEAGDEGPESTDSAPGAIAGDELAASEKLRLEQLAAQAEALEGKDDVKLQGVIKLVKELLKDGNQPIIFCRYIPTAEYVAEHLRAALGRKVEVAAVTGTLAPREREVRVKELGTHEKRVLVATDCLSEGVNLQESFDTVVHYDLAWNPTRHEQREGRVDRFGQPKPEVKAVTFYGSNSPVDGIVLEVLLRKHEEIRKQLGVSVPVPVDTAKIGDAILEGVVLRGSDDTSIFDQLDLFKEIETEQQDEFHDQWESAKERERKTRTVYAQASIGTDEVARELEEARASVGDTATVERFVTDALRASGATVTAAPDGGLSADIAELPAALRDAIGDAAAADTLELVRSGGVLRLTRTHPVVQAIAAQVVDTALDEHGDSVAARSGVLRTDAVKTKTTMLLLRLRIHLTVKTAGMPPRELLAEDAVSVAFTGSPESPTWIDDADAAALFEAKPSGNVAHELAIKQLQRLRDGLPLLSGHLEELAQRCADEILGSHRRVRESAKAKGSFEVRAQLPPDVLGMYVYLPVSES